MGVSVVNVPVAISSENRKMIASLFNKKKATDHDVQEFVQLAIIEDLEGVESYYRNLAQTIKETPDGAFTS
jgi:hypothetical protein